MKKTHLNSLSIMINRTKKKGALAASSSVLRDDPQRPCPQTDEPSQQPKTQFLMCQLSTASAQQQSRYLRPGITNQHLVLTSLQELQIATRCVEDSIGRIARRDA